MTRTLESIVVMGDVFRVHASNGTLHAYPAVRDLFLKVRIMCKALASCEVKIFPASERAWVIKLLIQYSAQHVDWPTLYEGSLPELLEDQIRKECKNSFVLGFELPPSVISILNKNSVPYVDVAVSPFRFKTHASHMARTNSYWIFEGLRKEALPELDLYINAAAYETSLPSQITDIPKKSAVFSCQTLSDRSLIRDKKITTILDNLPFISRLAESFSAFIVTSHPMERSRDQENLILKEIANSIYYSGHTYDLLSCREVSTCVSLSSGVSLEAKYFGKKGINISGYPWEIAFTPSSNNENAFMPLKKSILCAGFFKSLVNHYFAESLIFVQLSDADLSPVNIVNNTWHPREKKDSHAEGRLFRRVSLREIQSLLQYPDQTFIERCYEVFYGRPPDPAGLMNWKKEYEIGVSRLEIIHAFAISDEAMEKKVIVECDWRPEVLLKCLEQDTPETFLKKIAWLGGERFATEVPPVSSNGPKDYDPEDRRAVIERVLSSRKRKISTGKEK